MNIGKNIRGLRQKNGWSQDQVAKQLNISIPAFSKIETGLTTINVTRLNQLAKIFDVSVVVIMRKIGKGIDTLQLKEVAKLRSQILVVNQEVNRLQKLAIM
ncbi:MAG: helix-turn-helix domain-containing protein, partial [Pedobacter sp.]|nr:helix-turn-helix domain-containing protein [Pedobacter sp.]